MDSAYSADAIEKIESLVKAAISGRTVSFHETKSLPSTVFMQRNDGTITPFDVPRGNYRTTLDTPASFVGFVKEAFAELKTGKIFFNKDRAVYVFGEDFAKDQATCSLPLSPQFRLLTQLGGKEMPQKDFVRMLRVDLRGCLPNDSNLLSIVRNVKWSGSSEAAGAFEHGKQSVSRSVMAEIKGESAIPEETYVVIPVWENYTFNARIDCAIEINATDQRLALTPYPMMMRKAVDAAVVALGDLLASEGMPPAFLGSP